MALTDDEVDAVNLVWGGVASPRIDELEVFRYFNEFDARYLSHDLYLPLIARRLNDYPYTKLFENKALLDVLAPPSLFPRTVVRRIRGEYYDSQMRQIDYVEALDLVMSHDKALIVKPAVGSSGGVGIARISLDGDSILDEKSLDAFGMNYVIQECIEQSIEMSRFNVSSINTFRVTSLYLNGHFSICSTILRWGNPGSLTDNWGTGGNFAGVFADGSLYPRAFDARMNIFKRLGDTPLEKIHLACVTPMLDLVRDVHMKHFSLCKFVGWDVCVDSAGEYVFLEANTSQPGVFIEQIATGPIFGDRTSEVIDYVCGKRFVYEGAL